MEGRDIGTKVFPDADIKIFLDAAAEVRGARRFQQLPVSPQQEAAVVRELRERDHRDRHRLNSPLEAAADAILIDSTALTLEEVIARAEAIIAEKTSNMTP